MTAATLTRKLTKDELSEIESKLQGYRGNPEDDWYDEDDETSWSTWAYEYDKETVPGLGLVEVLDTYKGGEGGGEEALLVFYITPEDGTEPFHVSISGYYASYNGTEWDGDLVQVEPRQVSVTQYFTVK